jgi:hypothetical protein
MNNALEFRIKLQLKRKLHAGSKKKDVIATKLIFDKIKKAP